VDTQPRIDQRRYGGARTAPYLQLVPEAGIEPACVAYDESGDAAVGLERHLHDFLADNWEATELAEKWDLVEAAGDVKGSGYERPTPVARIDLLAQHTLDLSRWLVIELKHGRMSDEALAQVQRYMGWVKEKLAKVMVTWSKG
jgi:CRISPR/Cas system-associated exonuclease Cas4 (RecB family)